MPAVGELEQITGRVNIEGKIDASRVLTFIPELTPDPKKLQTQACVPPPCRARVWVFRAL